MSLYEILTAALTSINLIVVSIGIGYGLLQLKLLRKTYEDDHEWNRRHSAIYSIIGLSQANFNLGELNARIRFMERTSPIPSEEIIAVFEQDPSQQVVLHNLLTYYNSLAIGIKHRIFDEVLMREERGSLMIRIYETFEPYIKHRREKFQAKVWCDYEEIINKWRSERRTEIKWRNELGK